MWDTYVLVMLEIVYIFTLDIVQLFNNFIVPPH